MNALSMGGAKLGLSVLHGPTWMVAPYLIDVL